MLETKHILKVLYVSIMLEYDYLRAMIYFLKSALRCPRAVDVPSALSIDLDIDVRACRVLLAYAVGQPKTQSAALRMVICM